MKNCDDNLDVSGPSGYSDSYIKLSGGRQIFMSEVVTPKMAADISALLLYYDNKNQDEEITMYLHSDGGSAEGLANIYDIMQIIKAPITTICLGKCYSAAAVILAAGSKGKRMALKNSKIMIHGVQFAFPLPDHDVDKSKNYLEFVTENNDIIMKILAKHTGHDLVKVQEDCKHDLYMSAKEAKIYGLIDCII